MKPNQAKEMVRFMIDGLPDIRWVQQEDPMGCWVAAMAMVTGKTYAEVKAETGRMAANGGHCWATDQYLAQNGFTIQRYWRHDQFKGRVVGEAWHNDKRDPWPLAPFAPLHVCMVQTSTGHMVVMLADGTVLDPATPEPKRLSDYTEVHKIVGIWRAVSTDETADSTVPQHS